MSPTRETLLRTANHLLELMNSGDLDDQLRIRSPSCIHQTLPLSLGVPASNNEQFSAFLRSLQPTFHNFKVWLADGEQPIIDEVSRKVVMHLKGSADTDRGKYENEYIFILRTNEEGTLLEHFIEFVDSAYLKEYQSREPK